MVIKPGQCLYVDINRADTTFTALTGKILNLDNFVQPSAPYTRFVIAWAELDQSNITQVFTRDAPYKVGTVGSIATSTSYGTVELNSAQVSIAIVPSIDASTQNAIAAGISRGNSASVTNIGAGTLTVGGSTDDTTVNIGSGSNTVNVSATAITANAATITVNSTSTLNTNIGTGTNTGTTTIGNTAGGVTDINSPVIAIGVASSGTTALKGNNLIGDHTASIATVQGAQLQLGNSTQVTQTHFVDSNQAGVNVNAGTITTNVTVVADSLFNCTDHSGVVDVIVGAGGITTSSAVAVGTYFSVSFATAYANRPVCIINPVDTGVTPGWPSGLTYQPTISNATGFGLLVVNSTGGAVSVPAGTYKFAYVVVGK